MRQLVRNTILMALPAALILTVPAWAEESSKKVQGEVIQVQQRQQTQNQDEFDHLMIRTRQGEEMRLRLGQAGQCAGCVQVGDQIRARVLQAAGDQAAQIQSMKVKRNGQMVGYQNQGGQMVGTQGLVCSATRDPKALVDTGAFRGDLWLALGSLPIRVPPLRDRPEDLSLVVESMLQRLTCLRRCRELDPATLDALQAYSFPGNVRELINILERACLVAEGNVILPEHLPPDCRASGDFSKSVLAFEGDVVPLSEVETQYIEWAAKRSVGSQRALARRLGISERTLYRKLQKARNAPPKQRTEPGEADPSIE